MKTGLVMEGGAMRGMFTAGVTDVLMENGITFDGAMGVSAGAAFGCNYKSRQIGRAIRYNKRFCNDDRFASLGSWLKTGDLFNAEFCYKDVPEIMDPFDTDAFAANPMKFYCVATDVESGQSIIHPLKDGLREDVQWIRASSSMPIASRIVELGGRKLLDGGIANPIPLRSMEKLGYDRIVVIETQPRDYHKKKQKGLSAVKALLKDYPAVCHKLEIRHRIYNWQKKYIREKEEKGEILVIRPASPLGIGHTTKHPEELERVYQIGRQAAEERLGEIRAFLKQ